MTSKTYVIAGTRQEADYWIAQKIQSLISSSTNLMYVARSNYIYVDSPIRIRGIQDPHGVFIGNWKLRADILEIVQTLIYASTSTNKQLHDIHNSLRPTPKYKGNGYTQVTYDEAVAEAALQMAKHIDAHVLKQLMNPTAII